MPGSLDRLFAVENIARQYGVFRCEAYVFTLEALARATDGEGTHVSGEDLLECIRELGSRRYGIMAGDVFNAWGVRETLDFGRIVFHLVDAGVLLRRDRDNLADFVGGFDFDEAFALRVDAGGRGTGVEL